MTRTTHEIVHGGTVKEEEGKILLELTTEDRRQMSILLDGQDRRSTRVMRRLAKEDRAYPMATGTIRVQRMDQDYDANNYRL